MKKKLFFLVLVLCLLFVNPIFSVWNGYSYSPSNSSSSLEIGNFKNKFCSLDKVFVVDDSFKAKYMVFVGNAWVFKNSIWQDNDKVLYLRNITKNYAFIKTDIIYFVADDTYTLLDNGVPYSNKNSLSWAVRPISVEHVEGWAYDNTVVLGKDNNYYFARFYTITTPTINRHGWDKIEKVNKSSFYNFENTCFPNYNNPKPNSIIRSLIWESQTHYLVGDIVTYNNIKYIAVKNTINNNPQFDNSWEIL